MKSIIQKITVCFFTISILLQTIQPVSAANALMIREKYNTVGAYYGKDITNNNAVNQGIEMDKKRERLRYTNFFSPEIEAETSEEESFEFLKAMDEVSTVYVSTEDPKLKKLVIGAEVMNYEENGEYYPINAILQTTSSTDLETVYENQSNLITSRFTNDFTTGSKYNKKGVELTLKSQLIQAGMVEQKESQLITPLENDMLYKVHVYPAEITEEVIIVSTTEITNIEYEVSVTNGHLAVGEDTLTVYTDNFVPTMEIKEPVIKDSNGKVANITMSYENGIVMYSYDAEFLVDAVYPITIRSQIKSVDDYLWTMGHMGVDTTVSYNYANETISNPSQEELEHYGWVLPEEKHYEGYLYLGNNPNRIQGTEIKDSYTFYRLREEALDMYELRGKYIKEAMLELPIHDRSGENVVYGCTIDVDYDIESATYNNVQTALEGSRCTSEIKINSTMEDIAINVTDYLKGVIEKGKVNSGVLLMLEDKDNHYVTFHASEYYCIDEESGRYPKISILYYDEADVLDSIGLEQFSFFFKTIHKI